MICETITSLNSNQFSGGNFLAQKHYHLGHHHRCHVMLMTTCFVYEIEYESSSGVDGELKFQSRTSRENRSKCRKVEFRFSRKKVEETVHKLVRLVENF